MAWDGTRSDDSPDMAVGAGLKERACDEGTMTEIEVGES